MVLLGLWLRCRFGRRRCLCWEERCDLCGVCGLHGNVLAVDVEQDVGQAYDALRVVGEVQECTLKVGASLVF